MDAQTKQYIQELSFLYGGTTDFRKLTPSKKDKVLNKLLFVNLNDKKIVERELGKILREKLNSK